VSAGRHAEVQREHCLLGSVRSQDAAVRLDPVLEEPRQVEHEAGNEDDSGLEASGAADAWSGAVG